MTEDLWTTVDRYAARLLVRPDEALDAAERESASAGLLAMFVGGHRICCRFVPPNVVSISLNCAMRETGPIICTQPPFMPGVTRLSSEKVSSPFSCSQRKPPSGSNAMPKLFR